MRFGIISDIHSNATALRAVLAEFSRLDVDHIICLGDAIGIGAHPDETVQLLKNQPLPLTMVRGNHEDYLLKELPVYNHNDKNNEKLPQAIIDLFRWNHEQLSSDSIEFLRQWHREATIDAGNGYQIFVSHYPVDELSGKYRKFYMLPNITECREIFAGKPGDILLFGHTHIRCAERGYKDHRFFINPGSVGCPIGTDSASAGVLDVNSHFVNYEQLDVDYDIDHEIDAMLALNSDLPAVNYTVGEFYRNLEQ